MCHDYKVLGRNTFAWETTVVVEQAHNIHFSAGAREDDFVVMRTERDKTLSMPNFSCRRFRSTSGRPFAIDGF